MRTYLLLDIIQGIGGINGETDQDDMRVGVRERSESVVIFLSCGIPEGKFDVLSIDLDVRHVIFKNCGDVDLLFRKLVSLSLEQVSFSHR